MEKELVGALFGDASEGGNRDASSGGDKDDGGVVLASRGGKKKGREEELMSAEEVLRRVLQGIARPLQVGWWSVPCRVLSLTREAKSCVYLCVWGVFLSHLTFFLYVEVGVLYSSGALF